MQGSGTSASVTHVLSVARSEGKDRTRLCCIVDLIIRVSDILFLFYNVIHTRSNKVSGGTGMFENVRNPQKLYSLGGRVS